MKGFVEAPHLIHHISDLRCSLCKDFRSVFVRMCLRDLPQRSADPQFTIVSIKYTRGE